MTDSASPQMPPLDRDQVLDATAHCFERYGFEGTTIRRIAGRLNCAVGSIYRYFTDKQELLTAMSERQMADVGTKIDSGGSFDESMRLYVLRAKAAPQMYRLMFWLACVGEHEGPPDASDETSADLVGPDAAAPGIPAVVSHIVAGWSRRLGDARLAQDCWAMMHGSLMLGRSGDDIVRLLLKLLGQRAEIQAALVAPRSAPRAPDTSLPAAEAQARPATSARTANRQPAVAKPGGHDAWHDGGARTASPSAPSDLGDTGSSEDVCLL